MAHKAYRFAAGATQSGTLHSRTVVGHIKEDCRKVVIMIVESENKKTRVFKGVAFDVFASGERSMVTKMNYKIGDKVSFRSHPNEQSGYVISGEYLIQYGDITKNVKSGDSYCIPENLDHSWKVLKVGEVIDVFTPPRIDYL